MRVIDQVRLRTKISSPIFYFILLVTSVLLFQKVSHADHRHDETHHIAVLYPTVNKQYSNMFDELIAGIQSVSGFQFSSYRVDKDTSDDMIKQWSAEKNIDGYIALGQATYALVDALDTDLPLIAGGMVATPPGISGISLSADPESFFRYLQLLNPDINRVFFVYSQQNNGWLIERSRQISQQYDIEFIPLQVDDVKQATIQYKVVLNSVQPRTDAIWLPMDNIAPLDVLLPEILQVSWNKHITVFSNNLSYTRRGVLFSLYPDHYKQGRRLVALLQHRLTNKKIPAQLLPSIDLKIAVNVRTASHMEMNFDKEMTKKFDQIYPAYN